MKRDTLRWNLFASIVDGAVFSIMVGIGENAIVPFVLAMHPDQPVAAGLAASVPLMLGAILQLLAPRVVHRLQSHRGTVVLFSTIQALAFLPLAIGALVGSIPIWLIFASASLYWAGGLGGGAAWNTWAATLVPARIRARYFGRRARIIHAGVLGGLLAGGILLQFTDAAAARYAFAAMFFTACVCRLISTRLQAAQSEPIPMPPDHRRVGWRELLGRLSHGPDARLLAYMVAMQITINLAQPFFIPFVNKQLLVEPATMFLLIAAPYAARMLAFPMCGQLAHRIGARWLLWIGGLGLVPISGLWMVSGNSWYLFGVQFLAGLAWAAYELGTFLMIWETVAEGERTSIMTTFNLVNSGANAGGALIGGQILGSLGAGMGAYQAVFGLSLALRMTTIILLIRLHKMVAPGAAPPPPETRAEHVPPVPASSSSPGSPTEPPMTPRRPVTHRRATRIHPGRRQ